MRRNDREITERGEIDAILSRETVCRIAFAVDGKPYMVPLSYGFDAFEDALIIHTAQSGRKIDCITANPYVCFEIEGRYEIRPGDRHACTWGAAYESVIGYGAFEEIRDVDGKRTALTYLMRQQAGEDVDWAFPEGSLAATRVWRLRIESVTGKRSASSE